MGYDGRTLSKALHGQYQLFPIAGRASELAGRVSEPARRAAEPAGRAKSQLFYLHFLPRSLKGGEGPNILLCKGNMNR